MRQINILERHPDSIRSDDALEQLNDLRVAELLCPGALMRLTPIGAGFGLDHQRHGERKPRRRGVGHNFRNKL